MIQETEMGKQISGGIYRLNVYIYVKSSSSEMQCIRIRICVSNINNLISLIPINENNRNKRGMIKTFKN